MSALPPHDGGPEALVPARTIATWPEGSFVENLAIAEDGTIFVTIHPPGEIHRIDPRGGQSLFVKLPSPIAGLAFDATDNLFVTGGTPGTPGGIIWRVAPDASYERWLDLPEAIFLNGITQAPDGGMLAVDSVRGEVLHVSTTERSHAIWLKDERLTPLPGIQGLPGVNGIKHFADRYVLSNTTRAQLYAVTIDAAGAPGPLTLLADRLRADDIAFDTDGALYCTTHLHYSLVKLSPDGSRVTLAGPGEGMVGSTAAAFGRTAADATSLYVTATGGVGAPYQGQLQPAKLVRLDVGKS
jgi:sugar lactone lactonase YvrE